MKLNELKEPKNEAIDWSPLIGNYGQSFTGGATAGQDREGKMAKNIFVRNFMQKAISGLASAINSGLVDPNITGAAPTTQQPQTPAPAAPVAGAVGSMASQLGGNKPNTMANTPVSKTNTAKPGNPNAKSVTVAPQTSAQIRQQKQATATQAARAGMTAKPVTKPAVWRSGRNPSAPATTSFRENKAFEKLNNIFEGILNVNEATGQSISQYIQGLFLEYLHGVKVPMNDPTTVSKFKTLADEVQATYAKDNGKNALTKLADLGWALSHSPEARQPAAPVAAPVAAAATQQSTVGVKQINKIIPTLRKRDLLSVKKTIDNTLAGRGGPAAASTTVAPTTAPAVPNNIVKMPKGKAGQVRAAREGGVTPEEQTKFDQRVQQAMASQK